MVYTSSWKHPQVPALEQCTGTSVLRNTINCTISSLSHLLGVTLSSGRTWWGNALLWVLVCFFKYSFNNKSKSKWLALISLDYTSCHLSPKDVSQKKEQWMAWPSPHPMTSLIRNSSVIHSDCLEKLTSRLGIWPLLGVSAPTLASIRNRFIPVARTKNL